MVVYMKYYPVNLDIRNRICLVVGGGEVAARKAGMLLRCGGIVKVVSPVISDAMRQLEKTGDIRIAERKYRKQDSDASVFLIFACTDNAETNRRVLEDAAAHNILCNIADNPAAGHFTLPAVICQGDLVLSISTSGKSPALSRKIRKELEADFGPEYGECLRIMGNIRHKLLQKGHDPHTHRKLFRSVLDKGLLEMLKEKDRIGANRLLAEIFGEEYTVI